MTGFLTVLLTAAAVPQPSAAEQAAVFRAVGLVQRGSEWRSRHCRGLEGTSYGPAAIDSYQDLNGDGRPEAVVSEGSATCYGHTGTHFWLLSKQADGSWKMIASEIGIPEFLGDRGPGRWPDVVIGGPGFCFPVWRWNGREYRLDRFEYEGRRCSPPE